MSELRLSDGVVGLCPFGLDHVEAQLAGEDSELVRWLNGGPSTRNRVQAYARECEQRWIDGADPRAFAVTVDGSGQKAGYIDLRFNADYTSEGQVNISYGLCPQCRGRGMMTRAVELICDYAAKEGTKQAVIRTDPDNKKSAAVAARAGFRFEKVVTESNGDVFDRYLREL